MDEDDTLLLEFTGMLIHKDDDEILLVDQYKYVKEKLLLL